MCVSLTTREAIYITLYLFVKVLIDIGRTLSGIFNNLLSIGESFSAMIFKAKIIIC